MIDPARNSRLPIRLSVGTLLLAYAMTTGLGAALFPFDFGREQLAAFFYPQPLDFAVLPTLGSSLYWTLLVSFVLAPLSAMTAYRFGAAALAPRPSEVPLTIPVALAVAMAAFCIYKLGAAHALDARTAWDRSLCYEAKILRRVELIGLLGTPFYGFVYSALPILGCYFLARTVKLRERMALVACIIVSLIVFWLDLAILFKAPTIIYIGMLGTTLWLSGFRFLPCMAGATAAAIAVYLGLSMVQFCDIQVKSWEIATPTAQPESRHQPAPPSISVTPQAVAPAPAPATTVAPDTGHKALYMVRAVLFRVAAGFPYFVQTFSDPDHRCGIVRPERWLPRAACFPPVVVFREMFPTINYATGFQSAPVNVSAYAEGGLLYAFLATIACGLIVGLMAAFARNRSPLEIVTLVAACVYAYVATQASLTGSLVDSYGLAWLALPIAAIRMTTAARTAAQRLIPSRTGGS
ncbi:hypothetical protein [Bradyrhizobium japonicum]|uniref:hypothetical protein n=2 Tax=Bradyrhizobium japonicum TaxID=375 RepID=UPI000456A332|nr:hypothetical protein [Bradyrhizobium japonicum]AHY53067.1 hypothetical protein BJS_08722 [Bradyrhizobium japonicum SEMIA 5079]MEB2673272.1 hypothetical protein [Bradyrhizobium japonicum]WLB31847.1 hypothetical protein QIH85_14855 [Bradyrhizobium japonicum]WRI92491.1 hypothetical protein R3F75_16820 [Bradyrhizobium japonicum]WRJ86979.1 hypothetical protein R3F78_19840 [Bradyrhizobium japonicum]